MENSEVCIKFRSLRTSRMDFLYPQVRPPSPLSTPRVVDKTLEFLVAGIGHVASWSEAESQGGSSPCQKEEMTAARKSSPNSCVVVVPQRQRDPPQYDGPDLSGVPLLFSVPSLPPLSSVLLLP